MDPLPVPMPVSVPMPSRLTQRYRTPEPAILKPVAMEAAKGPCASSTAHRDVLATWSAQMVWHVESTAAQVPAKAPLTAVAQAFVRSSAGKMLAPVSSIVQMLRLAISAAQARSHAAIKSAAEPGPATSNAAETILAATRMSAARLADVTSTVAVEELVREDHPARKARAVRPVTDAQAQRQVATAAEATNR